MGSYLGNNYWSYCHVELKLCKVSKIRFPSTDLDGLTIWMNISFSGSLIYGSNHIYIFENRNQTSAGLNLIFAYTYIYIYTCVCVCDFLG